MGSRPLYYVMMSERTTHDDWHGLLVLDKPGGMTSRDAVNRVQRTLPRGTKIGHTGTLDPLATGILVVCFGRATRLAEYVQAMRKVYRSTFRLGATSNTDDADGDVTLRPDARPLPPEEIDVALARWVGEIDQVPPAFSAAKVEGQRAYDLARGGAEVELKSRRVRIDGIDVLKYEWPRLEVEVRCGKGTYIRSIARDLGAALACGGLVEALRRTRVGPFVESLAISPEADAATLRSNLRPVGEAVAELTTLMVNDADANRLRMGQGVATFAPSGEVAVFTGDGDLLGIARSDGTMMRPVKVLSSPE